jgi:FKBP-type peptidyl-prolyl cis-trans isomerase
LTTIRVFRSTRRENESLTERVRADITEPMNLNVEFLQFGSGAAAQPGQTAVVHYTGWLTDGSKFDSSRDRNEPFEFGLGEGQVIAGWDLVVQRLRVGDRVKATLPPELAYGEQAVGGVIPARSVLVFDIELIQLR